MKTRVVILTGAGRRHRFVANRWVQYFDVVGVVAERKRPQPQIGAIDHVMSSHYEEREQAEQKYMPESGDFLARKDLFLINKGALNSREVFDFVQVRTPQYLLSFGSSIIRAPLLGAYPDRIINLHLGLSPYYRGAASNFWALVQGEPECVGVTIHFAVPRVDAGPILVQGRPRLEPQDSCHTIGCKSILLGAELMPEAVKRLSDGYSPQGQDISQGHVFKRTEAGASSILKMRRNFEDGMINNFLADGKRLERFHIVV